MFVSFKNAEKMDLSRLEGLDIKCFDLCWERDIWDAMLPKYKIRLATNNWGLVGFWAGQVVEPTEPEGITRIEILKIGVAPKERNKGISFWILQDIKKWINSEFGLREVRAVLKVPESIFEPGWGTSCAGWLDKMDFKLSSPALTTHPHKMYGKAFSHAYSYDFPMTPLMTGF